MEREKIKNQSSYRYFLIRILSVFVILYLVVMSILIYTWVQNNIIPKVF